MSKPSCDACSNLREYNANFIMNGVTDDIAASLANNTGLNACLTDLHTDCEDLNDVNDCLIGHMDDDVDNYEVCDWKSLMHNFFPNLYETLKAMIASVCGLWTKIANIESIFCKYISKEATYVPASVGTHYFDTDEYWLQGEQDNKKYWPCVISLVIGETFDCVGKAVTWICPHMEKRADFEPGTRQGIKTKIPVGSIVSTYSKSDLVPTYLDEDAWDRLVSVLTKNGDSFVTPIIDVQNAIYSTLFGYDSSSGLLTIYIWSIIGGDGIGGATPSPIVQNIF